MSQTANAPFYTPPPWAPDQTLEWLDACASVQSMQFMIDCLPMIRKLLFAKPAQETFTALDVGAGTGAGANVLATLYQGQVLGGTLKVDAIELVPSLKGYADNRFPLVNYWVGDILEHQDPRRWDLVVCSHTIEHVERPEAFISFLTGLAYRWVLIYAPWKERD